MVPYEKLYKDSIKAAQRLSSEKKAGSGGMMPRQKDADEPDDDNPVNMNAFYIRMFWDMSDKNIAELRRAGEKRLGKGKAPKGDDDDEEMEPDDGPEEEEEEMMEEEESYNG